MANSYPKKFVHFVYVHYFKGSSAIGDIAVKISLANKELRSATPFFMLISVIRRLANSRYFKKVQKTRKRD